MLSSDFGDAPEDIAGVPTGFPTTLVNDGARHVVDGVTCLGASIDAEDNGQPTIAADGDDKNVVYPGVPYPNGDEDGVIFLAPLVQGATVGIDVVASTSGFLNGWIDFDGNLAWDPGEQVFTDTPLVAGTNTLSVLVPASAAVGDAYARFRFDTQGDLSFFGPAADGEVEDYVQRIYARDPEGIVGGGNWDIHMDIDGEVANDFHIEGRVVSGEPGQGWSQPPILVGHIDGSFPDFSYQITPDTSDPDQNAYHFVADWKGWEYQYCEVLHLGLFFELTCHNLVIDLEGWWTKDGEPIIAGQNGGAVLVPGFEVTDDFVVTSNQNIRVQNDSLGIGGKVEDLRVVKFSAEEVEIQFGSVEAMFPELRGDGAGSPTGDWPWVDVLRQGLPVGVNNPQDFPAESFFDVFFEVEVPGEGLHTATPMPLNPGDVLVALSGVEVTNNTGNTDFLYTWHLHEAHHVAPELDFGDAPEVDVTGVLTGFPTTLINDGARHGILRGIYLGNLVDAEPDGQPTIPADGDDLAGIPDDEDGVTFLAPLVQGATVGIDVVASTSGFLNGWIDFDGNLAWDPGEQVFTDTPLVPGTNTLSVMVPASAVVGDAYARFRFSTQRGLDFFGPAPDGEVEDYVQHVYARDPDGIIGGGNWDIHMDIDGVVANDFHIEGRVVSGEPGQGWSQPPILVGHIDGNFPDFSYQITPDTSDPDQNAYHFVADWKGWNYQYCEVLHLGLFFELTCHNLVIDLEGWWTTDGEPIIAGQNGGAVLVPGFEVTDDFVVTSNQRIRVQNDSLGIGGKVEDLRVVKFSAEEVETQFGSVEAMFPELRGDGAGSPTGDWPWVDVLRQGLPVGVNNPQDFPAESFFDVFFEVEVPGEGLHTATPMPLNPGDVLVALSGVEVTNNTGNTDFLYTWHLHEAHHVAPELDFGDAPEVDVTGVLTGFPTTLINDGARHGILRGIYLGNLVDAEPDGQPTIPADGDDLAGIPDDEDGVTFLAPLVQGATVGIDVVASTSGFLNGWIDFDGNLAWDPGEQVFTDTPLVPGTNTLSVMVPASAVVGDAYARFRFSTQRGLDFFGPAPDGEVEDYVQRIYARDPEGIVAGGNWDIHMDIDGEVANDFHIEGRVVSGEPGQGWSQPPILVGHIDGNFPDFSYQITPDTSDPDQNAYHFVADWKGWNYQYCEVLHLGLFFELTCHNLVIDLEGWWTTDGEPIIAGQNGGAVLVPGFEVTDDFVVTSNQRIRVQNDSLGIGGKVEDLRVAKFSAEEVEIQFGSVEAMFPELRGDGAGSPTGDWPWVDVLRQGLPVGVNNPQDFPAESFFDVFFEVEVPGEGLHTATPMPLNPGDVLVALSGVEVTNNTGNTDFLYTWHLHEAHHVAPELDFGDAPEVDVTGVLTGFPTTLINDGARHGILRGIYLGNLVDAEPDGQPTIPADGDDLAGIPDDEDGVTFLAPLVQGATVGIDVVASTSGFLNGWIDFDGNLAWDPGEQVFTDTPLVPGTNTLSVMVPASAVVGDAYARFRFSTQRGLDFFGPAPDGEVEDYVQRIYARDPEGIVAGGNWDIHMDIDGEVANDFHIEGRVVSGEPGQGWSQPPILVGHIDGSFPDFSYQITPDTSDPDQNAYHFVADWKGWNYQYCEVLHLGLFFELTCHNLVIDLEGWWTTDGEPIIAGQNGGAVLVPGFEVTDDFVVTSNQRIRVQNDSLGIGGKVEDLRVVKFSAEEVETQFGSVEAMFPELRGDGAGSPTGDWPWVDVLRQGLPVGVNNPQDFPAESFFDVFFEVEVPGEGLHTATPMPLNPGDVLVALSGVEVTNNTGNTDFLYTWHLHEAHHVAPELDFGDAPEVDVTGVLTGFPTTLINDGARHGILRGIYLGNLVDAEPDGQPTIPADGDDLAGIPDDEDGVTFLAPLVQGATVGIDVVASTSGFLNGWIDFDGNLAWDPGEQVFTDTPLVPGTNTLSVMVPASAVVGDAYARFRFSTQRGLDFFGPAPDGEVEDYVQRIYARDPEGIVAGGNWDIHMDIDGEVANDFHIEGRVVSGEPGQGWSQPPILVGHIDGSFPDFSYQITPDTSDPDQNAYHFVADWKGWEYQYCEVLHLGLFFELTCHNLAIDLEGWWTKDGEPIIAGQNGGAVLVPGFEVTDDFVVTSNQNIRVQNDSLGIGGQVTDLRVVKFSAEEVETQFGSLEAMFPELRGDGAGSPTGDWPWVDVLQQGLPVGVNNPQDFPAESFFDVFFEVEVPGEGLHTATPMPLNPGDVLVTLSGVEVTNNTGNTDFLYTWHLHQAHLVGPDLDFGDAPAGAAAPMYPTLLAQDGARHVPIGPWMGPANDQPDAEPNGQPHALAIGDDIDSIYGPQPPKWNDENGVSFTSIVAAGQPAFVDVEAHEPGAAAGQPLTARLNAWIDFNVDGSWDPTEQIFTDTPLVDGTNHLNFMVPATAVPTNLTFARFRISTQTGLSYVGVAPDGEVEDLALEIVHGMDFGDAPDPTYPTRLPNGARHVIMPGFHLGAAIDAEPDGQPSADALGDDNNILYAGVPDDEDGVVFSGPLVPGQTTRIDVTVTKPAGFGGFLNAWIDGDFDGSFTSFASEHFLVDVPVNAGLNTFYVPVPLLAAPGQTYTRFRLSSQSGLGPDGQAPDGEVEDYLVEIVERDDVKWLQQPDLTPDGIDIRADQAIDGWITVADDFECKEPGLLTDVHFWGSWLNDQPREGIENIHLSIHADDPVGLGGALPDNQFSQPDKLLWEMDLGAGQFVEQLVAVVDPGEHWYDPVTGELIFPGDTQVWEYDIEIDPARAFLQTGTPDNPIVYWLDIRVQTANYDSRFGWKTRVSGEHFNDDAVFRINLDEPPVWHELRYPAGHQNPELVGESVDMAFALTFEPVEPMELDWGDAPENLPQGNYPTVSASNGARHTIDYGHNFYLGQSIDGEPDGQPNADATGDDLTAGDEDGVTFTTNLVTGQRASVDVELCTSSTISGFVDAWIDFNHNSSWLDPGEHIIASQAVTPGTKTFHFSVPAGAQLGETFARFRLSSVGNLAPDGGAADGEVEDYRVEIESPTPRPDLIGFHRGNLFALDLNGNGNWEAGPGGDVLHAFGQAGDTPISGDWNGDGNDEIGFHRGNLFGLDYNGNGIWDGAAGGDRLYAFGLPGDTPIVGDWNGDGIDNIGFHRSNYFALDFNGDGLWQGTAGGDALYRFGLPGDTPVIGDWNADGADEIGFHRSNYFALDLNGNGLWQGTAGGDALYQFGLPDDTPIIGDWNADGTDEIGFHRSNYFALDLNGDGLWQGTAGGDQLYAFGDPGDTPLIGHWNSGATDNWTNEVGYHQGNDFALDKNANGIWEGTAGGDALYLFGLPGDTPLIGDFNGDRTDQIGFHRSNYFALDLNANGIWEGTAGGDALYAFGLPGDTPLIGDFNGDGIDNIGFHRSNYFALDKNGNGIWEGTAGGDALYRFGQPGDTPLVGDWNRDGIDNIGYHRDSYFALDENGNGIWEGTAGGDAQYSFGLPGDTPLIGDFNGDGIDNIGFHRDSYFALDKNGNGIWQGTAGGDALYSFGLPDDTPLIGNWTVAAPLMAASPVASGLPDAEVLTRAQLTSILPQAIESWSAVALSPRQEDALARLEVQIADLPGAMLGRAWGSTITLDINAAGYGWFVDPTPGLDEEFTLLAGNEYRANRQSEIDNRQSFDLLTAVMHEVGHVLDYDDDYSDPDSDDLMNGVLEPGIRRGLTDSQLDQLFTEENWWDGFG